MLFNHDSAEERMTTRVARLESYHQRHHGLLLVLLLIGLMAFVVWALVFKIDEVARATGEVIASSRVQVIQSVDGGVLSALNVREGDRVRSGQLLARLDQTRVGASVAEVQARLFALKAKAIRLRAEIKQANELRFPEADSTVFAEQVEIERALFRQRRSGLQDELRTLQVALDLSRKELEIVEELEKAGDIRSSEIIQAQRAVNEAEAKLVNRRNKFYEDVRLELAETEDNISQNEQVLARRQQEQADSIFTAKLAGIVKNIRVTTVGGVLRAGEELMQIIPVDDDLMVEAKVSPADIARVHQGLEATIRFDPYDYTIFGGVKSRVTYVSADTLKEETPQGEEIYYRVYVVPDTLPVKTTTNRTLEILPGMTAQIDIRTGDRTLMDYLLKPLRKTLSQSFTER